MIISTRGRYALRVMIDLAEHSDGNYIPMKDVAERQNISLKYLEKILPPLSKSNYIVGVHGKGGGYRLTKKPSEYTAFDILNVTEGSLCPVSCIDCGKDACPRIDGCRTYPMWQKLNDIVSDYLKSVTIEDLMSGKSTDTPVKKD